MAAPPPTPASTPGPTPAPRRRALRGALVHHPIAPALRSVRDVGRGLVGALRAGAVRDAGVIDHDWMQQVAEPVAARSGTGIRRAQLAALVRRLARGRSGWASVHPLFAPPWYEPLPRPRSAPDEFSVYLAKGGGRYGPHPVFDEAGWIASNPQAATHPGGALGHWLSSDADEVPVPWATGTVLLREPLRAAMFDAMRTAGADAGLAADRISDAWDEQLDASTRARLAAVGPVRPPADGVPLVSVVMPVRNRPEQIVAAIASVLAQTERRLELLVIDDGSTDDTADVVEAIAVTDQRVVLRRAEAAGVSAARNLAVAAARGRYVAFLDSDNTWDPDFLALMVAALHGDGLRAAHAGVSLRHGRNIRYRGYRGDLEHLLVRNHIDLNALVAELALVREVGGFDPELRRCVDHDLAIGLAARTPVPLIPFIGVRYDDATTSDRITTTESFSWLRVVLDKHLIDWDALQRRASERVPGRVSVLVPTVGVDAGGLIAVRTALTESDPTQQGATDLEVVVLDNGGPPAHAAHLRALAQADPRVRILRRPRNDHDALGWNLALAASTGSTVVLMRSGTEGLRGWLQPLVGALEDPTVVAAAPVVLTPVGVVASAGVALRPGAGGAVRVVDALAGHHRDDVTDANTGPVVAARAGALAVRAADLIAVRGMDPRFTDGLDDIDLCLRLARHQRPDRPDAHVVVLPGSGVITRPRRSKQSPDSRPDNVRFFEERWGGGLPVATMDDVGRARDATTTQPRPRRWAIKIAAPFGPDGDGWGDTHFAADLAAALRRLDQHVVVDRRGAHDRPSYPLDDIVVTLRGLPLAPPPTRRNPDATSILWVISHPDEVHPRDLTPYDIVLAASGPWAARMTARAGRPVREMLQATDPARFSPWGDPRDGDGPTAGVAGRVLFVGGSRGVERPLVRDAVAARLDLAVFGPDWAGRIPAQALRGSYLPNDRLPAAYREAAFVLADHWPDMAREGFVSNRVFDAVACGARVISDDVPGITALFGSSVQVSRDATSLAQICASGDGDGLFPDDESRRGIADGVRKDHSFDSRAAVLLRLAHAGMGG